MANEKRLIDANAMREDWLDNGENEYVYDTNAVLESIDAQPTVDAVEVVRCKDCKHKTVTSYGMVCECALPTKRMQDYYIYGSTILAIVEPDAFCSHGERREGE